MIKIIRPEDCCGCGACEQKCPRNCISLIPDNEGFWYPKVDMNLCIDCSICEKVCPVINQEGERVPLKVYAAKNIDEEVRAKSASGGIFTIIAENVINKGGVVFGVKFDENWDVVFDYTETKEGLEKFRRSKYVQAWLGNTYKKVHELLNQGRLVLFTGTPCQISGLRRFLNKNYEHLLLMDLICEGVPSPKVWRKYLEEEIVRQCRNFSSSSNVFSKNDLRIQDISFRNKSLGWKLFSFSLSFINNKDKNSDLPIYINRNSEYIQALINYLHLRPICYECPFKSCKSHSDITIADYWGISRLHPEMDDDKGTSMVYVHTQKGETFFDKEKTRYLETTYEEAFMFNNIITSSKKHPYRDKFFSHIDDCDSIMHLLDKYTFTKSYKMKKVVKEAVKRVLPSFLFEKIKYLWKRIR